MSNRKRVLIVDDSPEIRTEIKEILSKDSYDVVGEAQDGIEAFHMYKKFNPDLVTLDLIMPRESGLDALTKIIEYDAKAYVIVVTGFNNRYILMAVMDMGARDYVLKPFTRNELLEATRRCVRDRRLLVNSSPDS